MFPHKILCSSSTSQKGFNYVPFQFFYTNNVFFSDRALYSVCTVHSVYSLVHRVFKLSFAPFGRGFLGGGEANWKGKSRGHSMLAAVGCVCVCVCVNVEQTEYTCTESCAKRTKMNSTNKKPKKYSFVQYVPFLLE